MILVADYVLPISGPPIKRGAVVVEEGEIEAVGSREDLVRKYKYEEVLDFGRAAILPGLVNCHTHLCYTILRGYEDDLPLLQWLVYGIAEGSSRMEPEDLEISALLGCVEALKAGTTCLADVAVSLRYLDSVAKTGIRAIVYREVMDLFARDPEEVLEEALGEIERCGEIASRYGRISLGISPHSPYTTSPDLLEAALREARERGLPASIHLAESREEVEFLRNGRGTLAELFGRLGVRFEPPRATPLEYLDELGVLSRGIVLAHCVHLGRGDLELMESGGVAVAHCPRSNAKLGCGIAPLAELLRRGIPVGLGTDSAASSNSLSVLEEARFALLLQRAVREDVGALDARAALELATLGGARALGLGDVVGSLERGKRADLVVVSLKGAHCTPAYDPYSALAYSAISRDVVFVMIDGEVVVEGGRLLRVDEERVLRDAERVAEKIAES